MSELSDLPASATEPPVEAAPAAAPARSRRARAEALQQGVLADVVGYQIVQAQITTLGIYFRNVGEVLGLRPVEYSLLMLLHANSAVTPKQLAQALELSAPNLTILLDKQQERGRIERVRSETDRRSQHVLLTAAGRALAEQAIACTPRMEAELADCLSPAERAMLLELLGKVARFRRE
ncbi:MAG: hypothetical protein RJA44_327 [Pseudomonadota bacterium]